VFAADVDGGHERRALHQVAAGQPLAQQPVLGLDCGGGHPPQQSTWLACDGGQGQQDQQRQQVEQAPPAQQQAGQAPPAQQQAEQAPPAQNAAVGALLEGGDASDEEWRWEQAQDKVLASRRRHVSGLGDFKRTKRRTALEAEEHEAALRRFKRPRRASGKALEGGGWRRRSGGGMAGFGAAVGHRGGAAATHQPMQLLPGEEPLGVEILFGEGRPLLPGAARGAAADGASSGRQLPSAERYNAAVERARRLLG
jgi:hypothetical protein